MLVRRVKDVKKNLTAKQRYLDLVREKVELESRNKSLRTSLQIDTISKQLGTLQASSGDTVRSLRILQTIFAGVIAFDILDRLTGEWTVMDAKWMTGLVDSFIKQNPLVWFITSIVAWLISAYLVSRHSFIEDWKSRGTMTMSIVVNRNIGKKIDQYL